MMAGGPWWTQTGPLWAGTTDLPAPAGRANQLKLKNCWWAILDSNQGPQSYQDCALTS